MRSLSRSASQWAESHPVMVMAFALTLYLILYLSGVSPGHPAVQAGIALMSAAMVNLLIEGKRLGILVGLASEPLYIWSLLGHWETQWGLLVVNLWMFRVYLRGWNKRQNELPAPVRMAA